MQLRILFSFVLLFFLGIVFGQLESAFWYFGNNQGLDFNSGTAVPISDGNLSTAEGCAAISTPNGDLIFYTDGENDTFTRDHNIMPNSAGLLGDNSSSQSAIIIPHPGNADLFYIITVDASDSDPFNALGMHYSVVDLSLNGGLGAIDSVEKNINLLPRTSEKLTAVQHRNGRDFWLITHFEDSFYSFLVDSTGINTTPVVSQVGENIPFSYFDDERNTEISLYPNNSRGYIKANVQGTQLAIAHLSNLKRYPPPFALNGNPAFNANNSYSYIQDGLLALYNLDNSTGQISDEIILGQNGSYYGIEFSPNGNYLYATRDFFNPPVNPNSLFFNLDIQEGAILQYDLNSVVPQLTPVVLSTETTSNSLGARGALQLGLDQKIYHTQRNERGLSVINQPNEPGVLADYVHLQLDMPGTVQFGLPPFVTSFFDVTIEITGTVTGGNGCIGTELTFSANSNSTIVEAVWDFGDGSNPVIQGDLSPIAHTFNTAGSFTVEVQLTDEDGRIVTDSTTVTINEKPILDNNQVVLTECEIDNNGLDSFTLSDANGLIVNDVSGLTFTYFETFDAANTNSGTTLPNVFTNTSANQVVFARVENENGCHAIAEVTLATESLRNEVEELRVCDVDNDGAEVYNLTDRAQNILGLDLFDAVNDTYSLFYYRTLNDAMEQNNVIETPEAFLRTTSGPDTIFVRVESGQSCNGVVQFDLGLDATPFVALDDVLICEGEIARFDAGAGFESYTWEGLTAGDLNQDLNQQSIAITQAGVYNLTVTNNHCSYTTTVEVVYRENPQILEVITEETSAQIIATPQNSDLEYSLDGTNWQSSNFFANLESGLYTAYVRNSAACTAPEKDFVIFTVPNAVTPNGDGKNDYWKIPGLTAFGSASIQIFDRYGKLITDLLYINPMMNTNTPTDNLVGSARKVTDVNKIWDATYLGRPVPSTSYWYLIELPTGKIIRGWVAVKNF